VSHGGIDDLDKLPSFCVGATPRRSTSSLGRYLVVSLFDVLRLTGVFIGIYWTFQTGSASNVSTWASSLIAGAVGVGAAWVMTAITRRLARAKSEALLLCAYLVTLVAISLAGAAGGFLSYRLMHIV
jgi:hypothetical protein